MSFYMIVAHASFGGIALLCAIVAMIVRKGSPLHRKTGLVFAYAMTATTILACVIATIRPNLFLFLIGVFSLYLVLAGWRAGRARARYPARLDYLMSFVALAGAAAMIGVGGYRLSNGNDLGTVLLVFGGLFIARAIGDLREFRAGPIGGKQRIIRHLTAMIAAFIAASTAFLVVTAEFLPWFVQWFGPTVALVPVIIYHRRKLEGGRKPAQAAG